MDHWCPPKLLQRLRQLYPTNPQPPEKGIYTVLEEVFLQERDPWCQQEAEAEVDALFQKHGQGGSRIARLRKALIDGIMGPMPSPEFRVLPDTPQLRERRRPVWYTVVYEIDIDFGLNIEDLLDLSVVQSLEQLVKAAESKRAGLKQRFHSDFKEEKDTFLMRFEKQLLPGYLYP